MHSIIPFNTLINIKVTQLKITVNKSYYYYSKIFERLILNKISKLEKMNEINLVGKQQHGFVKGKSTATAGLLIQSMIA